MISESAGGVPVSGVADDECCGSVKLYTVFDDASYAVTLPAFQTI